MPKIVCNNFHQVTIARRLLQAALSKSLVEIPELQDLVKDQLEEPLPDQKGARIVA